jgi:hypothetical protein
MSARTALLMARMDGTITRLVKDKGFECIWNVRDEG